MRAWIALAQLPDIGPRVIAALIARFGSPEAILAAPEAALRDVAGVGPTRATQIVQWRRIVDVDAQLRLAEKCGAEILPVTSPRYPERLKQIYDPPAVLYVRGTIEPRDFNAVAFVGARRAGHYGKRVTEYLAGNCARFGLTIVSGMAAGVDTAAHQAAIDAGGRTIAVIASGVDVPYPKFNAMLMDRIVQHGAVVSEAPLGAQPDKRAFPRRNRLISGLSLGVVVAAASQKSGAVITARHAMEQGREVMAVPGDIFSPNSDGVHALLRDGATLVQDPFDIRGALEPQLRLDELSAAEETAVQRASVDMSTDETKVFNLLSMAPVHIDDVMAQCELPAATAAAALLQLELRGLARQLHGKHFVRAT